MYYTYVPRWSSRQSIRGSRASAHGKGSSIQSQDVWSVLHWKLSKVPTIHGDRIQTFTKMAATKTGTSFAAATAVKALSSHEYEALFVDDWCIGSGEFFCRNLPFSRFLNLVKSSWNIFNTSGKTTLPRCGTSVATDIHWNPSRFGKVKGHPAGESE